MAAKSGTWCAIDFEGWERDHTVITEMGYSILQWDTQGKEIREDAHWIIKEAEGYRNGTYVPDYRYVSSLTMIGGVLTLRFLFGGQAYNFGESEKIPRSTFKGRVRSLIERLKETGPLYLVFHDNSQDIKYMKSPVIDAPLDDLSYLLPDTTPVTGLFVVDTSDLFGALTGSSRGERRSLEKTCRMLQITTMFLHNAGNDAHVS